MPGLLAILTVLATALPSVAAPLPVTPQPFVSGLAAPVEITHANDFSGRLFVVEQDGRIRIIRDGQLLATPFLDLSSANGGPVLSGGERGLLGLAFHPGYAANGRFFVFYNRVLAGDGGGSEIVVARYARSAQDANLADPASGTVVILIPHPQYSNHNGGKIAFGPDGYLYIAVGDGGGGGDPFDAAQSLSDLRGKILRIDVDGAAPYAIPPSNPFAASVNPVVRREIWAYGLRNPWRFSFDRVTGDLFIADVGQGAREEIDFESRATAGGRNYGWSVFEASLCYRPAANCALAGHVPPILEYAHVAGNASVTGGYRYRGTGNPDLAGHYVYGDFGSGRIWAAAPDTNGNWVPTQIATVPGISTFGEDENGELYGANIFAGTILRVTTAATAPPRLANISTRGQVLAGNDVMIGGFVIGGTTPKKVLVTARGPSLAAFGVPGVLANPTLQLFSGQTVIASNDDWQADANAAGISATGVAPPDAREAALLVTLNPGAYTAIVSGAGGGTGIGIVEVFEMDRADVPLVDISTRGQVQAGDSVMIGGFILHGGAPRTVLVTARGPSLAASGVTGALSNPRLELYAGQTVIAANDDWIDAPNANAIRATGVAPADALESAILVTLDPGAYTAIVRGAGNTGGVGIVEVFAR